MVGDNLGPSSAYWTTWGFDAVGNRTSQVQHSTTGGTDTTTSYNYNGNGAGQPGTLTSTATTGGSSGSTSYGYDAAGNMTSRNAGQGGQTLTWSDAGLLTAITGGTAGDSHFVYDADGSLLLEKDPGATTLYLPGEQITLTGQTTSGIRYYPMPGGGVAYRTGLGSAYGFEITDQHGTPFLTLDNTAQIATWRQLTPFGAPRGAVVPWVDNRGFLDKPTDTSTGLTIIGAREYDPGTGRFISLDPILEASSPQQLNGYTYATDNPVTQSDPTGLMLCADNLCGSVQFLEHHTSSASSGGGGGGGICYYCHYAPPQYYGGNQAGGICYSCHYAPPRYYGPVGYGGGGNSGGGYRPSPLPAHSQSSGCSILHWCLHVPDYVTLDTSFFTGFFALGGGVQVTLARDGQLFVGPQGGFGTPGFGSMLRAGWIGGPWGNGVHSDKAINNFVGNWSITASGQVHTPLYGAAVGAGETWGNPFHLGHNDFATEAGIGYSDTGVGITGSYSWDVFNLGSFIKWAKW
jgi:RHS repeat-associated protein